MFYATFSATVRNTHVRFKDSDTFPAMTVNTRLSSGDLCTVHSSNPMMMLFMMNSVIDNSDWLIRGEITDTSPYIDSFKVPRIIYFCVPDCFQELPDRKMAKAIEHPLKRFSLDDDFPGKLNILKKIILGLIIFQKYKSVECTSEVDLDERIAYFTKTLGVDYNSIEEVETDFYECSPNEKPADFNLPIKNEPFPTQELSTFSQ